MLLSAVSVLVVAQNISEVPEGLKNDPVYIYIYIYIYIIFTSQKTHYVPTYYEVISGNVVRKIYLVL